MGGAKPGPLSGGHYGLERAITRHKAIYSIGLLLDVYTSEQVNLDGDPDTLLYATERNKALDS